MISLLRASTSTLCGIAHWAVVLLVLLGPIFAQEAAEQNQPTKVRINDAELHYVERGQGSPVVLIHGGLVDYRRWGAQMGPFARRYRVIAYSRRYNHPNNNLSIRPDHSAIVEAEDLTALIKKLKLERVHMVGESYGAYTALFLALKQPELVRTLVLAEPPVFRWVQDIPEGGAVFDEFMNGIWKPAAQAFRSGNDREALRVTVDYFIGKGAFDQLPQEFRAILIDNIREWKALTTSRDAFPLLRREQVKRIATPTLMLTGGRTLRIHQLVNDELERLLPNGERVRIDATHEMWDEQPEACRQATLAFLAKH
jgi:pimeloyl-ACP methyl ester carboxylesterase